MFAGYFASNAEADIEAAAQRWIENMNHKKQTERPRTAADSAAGRDGASSCTAADLMHSQGSGRPMTAAVGLMNSTELLASLRAELTKPEEPQMIATASRLRSEGPPAAEMAPRRVEPVAAVSSLAGANKVNMAGDSSSCLAVSDLVRCRVVTLVIESTWGDLSYAGLTGLELLLGTQASPANLDSRSIDADPRDLSVIGRFDDPRTPDKLLNGINDTTDESNMWLIPFSKGSIHRITLDLGVPTNVAGIRIWNYNKSPEDALRGARVVSVFGDKSPVGRFIARLAPGCDGVNYAQTVLFNDLNMFYGNRSAKAPTKSGVPSIAYVTPSIKQSFETPVNPNGMLWKFTIYSNWGDSYYVGLDALEFVNEQGDTIDVAPVNISGRCESLISADRCRTAVVTAVPYSVSDLPKSDSLPDKRVPFNLVDKTRRKDSSGHSSWLAPLAHCMDKTERRKRAEDLLKLQSGYRHNMSNFDVEYSYFEDNVLYVMFDHPVSISCIR
jgi:hypothetical protein